jgi:hypothetical protein
VAYSQGVACPPWDPCWWVELGTEDLTHGDRLTQGDVKLARAMVLRGADVDGTDGDRYTALLVAARWNRSEMCRFLIEELQANIHATNNEGDNAYNLAKTYLHDELAEYLASVGVRTKVSTLRQQRQLSVDAWIAVVKPTPTSVDLESIRDSVHQKYAELQRRKLMAAGAEAISAATGLTGMAAHSSQADGDVLGQLTFPVAQVRGAHVCLSSACGIAYCSVAHRSYQVRGAEGNQDCAPELQAWCRQYGVGPV